MSWDTVPLSSVATIDRNSIGPADIETGTAYLGLEDIESGGRILGAQCVENGDLASSKFRFTPNHILYGKLRPYLAKIAFPDFTGICSTDILPVLPSDAIDKRFLGHFLKQPHMVDFANSRSSGANLPRLSPKELAKFPIPLPPLAEQKRIAGILDAADALRAQRREALAHLDTLLQSTFLDTFGDPVTNPKGWDVSSLGTECLEVRNGHSIKQKKGAGGVPISRIETISEGVLNPEKVGYAGLQLEDVESHLLRHGDILFSHINSTAHLCKCAMYLDEHGPLVHGMNLLRLRVGGRLHHTFLLYLIKCGSYRATLMRHENPAVNQSSIAASKIKAHDCPVPPLELQNRFATIVESIEQQKTAQWSHLAELDTLFGSLQSRAFAGEL